MKKYIIYSMAVAFALSAMFIACKKDKDDKGSNGGPVTEEGIVINGVRWATRNLDIGGHFVAKPEDYGALFQWGRRADGHESRTSFAYPTNDESEENGVVNVSELDTYGQIPTTHAAYGKFVKQSDDPYDWRTPQDDNLWGVAKTANDPSPTGWRVPTHEELESLANETYVTHEWTTKNGINGYRFTDKATGNTLFLPAAGERNPNSSTLIYAGMVGSYWGSSVTGAYYLSFFSGTVDPSYYRAAGRSLRCVAEKSEL